MVTRSEKAPDFCLPDKDSNNVCLKDFKGKWIVLYFYPKDNTKGCTLEALDFTENLMEFETMNAVVIGVSPDSVKSHQSFAERHQLQVMLLSDPDHTVLEQYGVWQLKKMYGREYYGVVRSTFLINPEGVIVHSWRNVKVKNHVNIVKEKLQELQKEN
ncbi:MAG: thioredoxin-dependent thiol peroxidase [Theionarchaea archaeon]|nr:thioredoxin-dependent thiol peroxidase [Theionarchaea archaeon]